MAALRASKSSLAMAPIVPRPTRALHCRSRDGQRRRRPGGGRNACRHADTVQIIRPPPPMSPVGRARTWPPGPIPRGRIPASRRSTGHRDNRRARRQCRRPWTYPAPTTQADPRRRHCGQDVRWHRRTAQTTAVPTRHCRAGPTCAMDDVIALARNRSPLATSTPECSGSGVPNRRARAADAVNAASIRRAAAAVRGATSSISAGSRSAGTASTAASACQRAPSSSTSSQAASGA